MKTLEKIETFLVLAECSSFIETAKRLYCSQPTISNHIQQLEEQFHCKLFYRNGKSIQLTKQGELFLQYAKQITHLFEEAEVKLQQSVNEEILSLYASSYIAGYFFPDILGRYRSAYPKQAMEIHTYCYEDLKSSLQDGKTSFALMPIYPEDEYIQKNFQSTILFEDEFPLILPPNHPLTGRKAVYTRDLNNETLLLPRSRYLQEYVVNEFEHNEVKARFLQMSNFEVIKQAIKSQLGIAFLPYSAAAREIERGELACQQVSSFRIKRKNGLVVRKNTHLTDAELQFFQVVERYFGA